MLKQSAYNLKTPAAGQVILTNLLSRTVLTVAPEAIAFLEAVDGTFDPARVRGRKRKFLEALMAGLFVLPENFDEWTYINARHRMERDEMSRFNLIVAPTIGCNMACHYCFENRREERLHQSQHDALVQYIGKAIQGYKALHVQWFGGEPLLAVDSLRSLSPRFAALASREMKTYSAEVITNGFHLDGILASELAALGVSDAQVTLEGMRRLHDRIRRPADGQGSFDRIVSNMESAAEHLAITLRIHVAPYNLESVRELLEFLAGKGLAKKLRKIYFSPLFNYKSGVTDGRFEIQPRKFFGSEEFAHAQCELLALAARLEFQLGDPLDVSYGLCTGVKTGSVVVSPDGTLAKCYLDVGEADAAFGSIDGSSARLENLRVWENYDFSGDPECRACQFAPVCLGGCPKQNAAEADKRTICTPLKFNFHDRMRMHYQISRDSRP